MPNTAKLPIYIGDSRMIAFLDSGEPIVVDTTSYDALDYVMGWGLEQDVTPLFQRMLRHDSVVLDIGANVGYYTIKAASRVASHGLVHSFEGNPHTYDLLERTLYANKLFRHKNVKIHNCLVGDKEGEAEIRYSLKGLGGASIWRDESAEPDSRTQRVKAVTLDSFLPSDLIVDIVKIDVEGHEPYVLRGMENVIRRSPNIKIIIEFFPSFFEKSFGGAFAVQQLIKSLGLSMWRIHDLGTLTSLPLDVPITEDNYCLLARNIDDIGAQGRNIVIEPMSLSIVDPYKDAADPILKMGRIVYSRDRYGHVGDDVDHRIIFYGPYINLEPGSYALGFSGSISGKFEIRLQHDFGRTVIDQYEISSFKDPRLFNLQSAVEKFEIVLIRGSSSRTVGIDLIVLKKL